VKVFSHFGACWVDEFAPSGEPGPSWLLRPRVRAGMDRFQSTRPDMGINFRCDDARRNYGQEFWWKRGEPVPERGPEFQRVLNRSGSTSRFPIVVIDSLLYSRRKWRNLFKFGALSE